MTQQQTVAAPGKQARRGGFADAATQPAKRARKAAQAAPAARPAAPAMPAAVGPVWWWWQ